MAGLLTIIVVYGGLIGAIVLLSKADNARASRKCRAAALPLGLTVRDVEREVPISRDRGRTWELETADIAEYRLARPSKASTTWRLLARAGEQHGNLPPGCRLEIQSGKPSDELRAAIVAVVAEEAFHGEFFEFEGTRDAVTVYWNEWGGQRIVQCLHRHLLRLASIPS